MKDDHHGRYGETSSVVVKPLYETDSRVIVQTLTTKENLKSESTFAIFLHLLSLFLQH